MIAEGRPHPWYSPGVTDREQQPATPNPLPGQTQDALPDGEMPSMPFVPRREPGEPHPYMLQRNPPNLWILVAITIFSLILTVAILALTVLL